MKNPEEKNIREFDVKIFYDWDQRKGEKKTRF